MQKMRRKPGIACMKNTTENNLKSLSLNFYKDAPAEWLLSE